MIKKILLASGVVIALGLFLYKPVSVCDLPEAAWKVGIPKVLENRY